MLAGRDSLAGAYDLGVDDGNASMWTSGSHAATALVLASPVAATGLVKATRKPIAAVYTFLAAAGGIVVATIHTSNQPLPVPPDSMQAVYGLKSPVMWDQYLAGFHDAVQVRRHSQVTGGYTAAAIEAVLAGIFDVMIQFVKGIASSVR